MLNLHIALCTWFQAIFFIYQIQLHKLFRYIKFVIQSHGPEMIRGKQRKRKTYFFYFFYWLLSSQKTQKCSDAFRLSAVDFAQCSIFDKIIRPVSHCWSRQIGNRKGVTPKGILLSFELRAAPPVWCPQNFCPQLPGTKLCLSYQSCARKSG